MSHLRFPSWQVLIIHASNLSIQNHNNMLTSVAHRSFVTLQLTTHLYRLSYLSSSSPPGDGDGWWISLSCLQPSLAVAIMQGSSVPCAQKNVPPSPSTMTFWVWPMRGKDWMRQICHLISSKAPLFTFTVEISNALLRSDMTWTDHFCQRPFKPLSWPVMQALIVTQYGYIKSNQIVLVTYTYLADVTAGVVRFLCS